MATVSENTVAIKLAVSGASALANHFRQSSQAMDRFNKQIQNGTAALASWSQIGAAFLSAQAFSRFFRAAQESSVAVSQLGRALVSTGQSAGATTGEFVEQAQALQRLTGVADETVLAVQRTLIQFGAQADVVKELTPLVLDLASAMGTDAVTAAKQVGRALDGEEIKLDRINIRAKNTADLMRQMRAAFGGQAAAEFGARGGLARLAVSIGELEEAIGRFAQAGSDRFFQRLADGIDAAAEATDRFREGNPELFRFASTVGGAAGKLIADNLGLIAIGLAAMGTVIAGFAGAKLVRLLVDPLRAFFVLLTGTSIANAFAQARVLWATFMTDGPAALRVFMGAGTRFITVVGLMTGALAGLAAAFIGVQIGTFLNPIEVAGEKIETHLTRAILRLQLAWLEFLHWLTPPGFLGGAWTAEFEEQIEVMRRAIADLKEEVEEPVSLPAVEAAAVPVGESGPELATRVEMLAVERDRLATSLRFAETEEERIDLLNRQLAVVRQMEAIKRQEATQTMVGLEHTKAGLDAAKALNELAGQRLDIEKEIRDLEKERAAERQRQIESTFPGGTQARFDEFRKRSALEAQMGGGRLGIVAGMQEAMMQLGTSAQIVGRAMTTFIGGAVDSIAGGIKGLLTMTMSWADALKSIAGGIFNSVIDAISRMFAEWIVGRLLTSSVEKTAAAGEAAAKAPVALFDSISSFGVAAAVGIAALLAAMAALGSFESGGYTGAGPRGAPAGVVHRGEYVVPAKTVQSLGLDWFEAAAAGMVPSSANQAPSTGSRPLNQKLNVFLDRRAWLAASRDDIEAIAIDAMARAGWRTAGA